MPQPKAIRCEADTPFTDAAIKNARAQPKVSKLSDGGDLQLSIMPNGAKLWRLRPGLIPQSQKMMAATIEMAEKNVWTQQS